MVSPNVFGALSYHHSGAQSFEMASKLFGKFVNPWCIRWFSIEKVTISATNSNLLHTIFKIVGYFASQQSTVDLSDGDTLFIMSGTWNVKYFSIVIFRGVNMTRLWSVFCVKIEFHLAFLLIAPAVHCNHWCDVTLMFNFFCVSSVCLISVLP